MKNIFTEIEEVKARIQEEPRNPHFRYQLGQLYLEIRNTHNKEAILEYLPMARNEFVYTLALEKTHIRALCSLAKTEDELWKLRKDKYQRSRSKQETRSSENVDSDAENLLALSQEASSEYQSVPNRGLILAERIVEIAEGAELDCEELLDVADVLYILKCHDEGASYIERARQLDPQNKRVILSDIPHLREERRFEEIAEIFTGLVERFPEDYEMRYDLMTATAGDVQLKGPEDDQSFMRWKLLEERFSPLVTSPYSTP